MFKWGVRHCESIISCLGYLTSAPRKGALETKPAAIAVPHGVGMESK